MKMYLNSYFIDKKSNKTILYLHGWNTSYQTMLTLSQKNLDLNELFIDLPGCGKSKEPISSLTISDYVEIILDNLEDKIDNITYIVGHSFGGKLAIKLANHFKNLKGLFLISPSIVKAKRTPVYYFKILKYKLFKKLHLDTSNMGSNDFKQASDVMKKTLVNVVNEDGIKEIKAIETKTLLVWAKDDKQTPLKMAKTIKRNMKDCKIIEIYGDHFGYLSKINQVNLLLKDFILEVENNADS